MSTQETDHFPLVEIIRKCVPKQHWEKTVINAINTNGMKIVDELGTGIRVGFDSIVITRVRALDVGREMFDGIVQQFVKMSHTLIIPPIQEGPLPKAFNITMRSPTVIVDVVIFEEAGDVYKYTNMTITLKRPNSDLLIKV